MVDLKPISPLISLEEAAAYLGVSIRWLRDHAERFGGTREFGKLKFFREILYGRVEATQREMELRIQVSGETIRELRLPDKGRGQGRRRKRKRTGQEIHDPHDLLGSRN